MKNNFENILGEVENSNVSPKKEVPTNDIDSKEALEKFRQRKKHKTDFQSKVKKQIVSSGEERNVPFQKIQRKSPVVKKIATKQEDDIPAGFSVELNLVDDLEPIEDTPVVSEPILSEEVTEAESPVEVISNEVETNIVDTPSTTEVVIDAVVVESNDSQVSTDAVISEASSTIEEVIPEPVVEEVLDQVQVPVIEISEDTAVAEEPELLTEVVSNEEPTIHESKFSKPKSKKKLVLSKFLKKDYNSLLNMFVVAGMVAVILIVTVLLISDKNIVETDVETKVGSIQRNDQIIFVDSSDEEITYLKALNEGLPVNYYSLLDVISKEKASANGNYILVEDLFTTTDVLSATTIQANGREHSANAVFSSWGLKGSNTGANAKINASLDSIRIVMETALEGKDKAFYLNDKAVTDLLSFNVERVIGEKVEVKKINLYSNFKE